MSEMKTLEQHNKDRDEASIKKWREEKPAGVLCNTCNEELTLDDAKNFSSFPSSLYNVDVTCLNKKCIKFKHSLFMRVA